MKPNQPANASAPPDSGPMFRSGAVARLANMPVATLRIWEQRYGAVRPATAKSGHRLYSPADVQRVLLLRQLTEQGHAIGSIAALDAAELQQVSRQSSRAPHGEAKGGGRGLARTSDPLRLVVVGAALAARLQRATVVRQLVNPVQRVAVFESLSEAAQASPDTAADLLVWHAPELRPEVPEELEAAQRAWNAARTAVVYRFAGSAAIRSLADAGVATLREPPDDEALGVWLGSNEAALARRPAEDTAVAMAQAPQLSSASTGLPPRRYDDATLTAIAGLPPTIACECPRHVADLLMQLSSFEAYSAGCINRNSAEADLHVYLQQVAGASRALFEAALERVARHEGLALG